MKGGVCDTIVKSSATMLPSPSHSSRPRPGSARLRAAAESPPFRKMVDAADGNGEYLEEPDDHLHQPSFGMGKGSAAIYDDFEEDEKYVDSSCEASAENHVRFSESSNFERRLPSKRETFESGHDDALSSRNRDGKLGVGTSNDFNTNRQSSVDTTGREAGECVSDDPLRV